LLHDRSGADDVIQDTAAKLGRLPEAKIQQYWESYRPIDKLLFVTIRNAVISLVKRNDRQTELKDDTPETAPPERYAPDEPERWKGLIVALEQCMTRLIDRKPKQAGVIIAFYEMLKESDREPSHAELAEKLSVKTSNLKCNLFHGRAALRECLGKKGYPHLFRD
jgi:DNA-directed RNA polymerase specialized sigma24 family protein